MPTKGEMHSTRWIGLWFDTFCWREFWVRVASLIGLVLYVIGFFLLAAGYLSLSGCAKQGPTAPTPLHPYEVIIVAHTECFAEFMEWSTPDIFFTDNPVDVECVIDGEKRMCPSAGRAYIGYNRVVYWGAWVRGEAGPDWGWSLGDLEWVAAHEVCHLALATANEDVANSCARWAVKGAGC